MSRALNKSVERTASSGFRESLSVLMSSVIRAAAHLFTFGETFACLTGRNSMAVINPEMDAWFRSRTP